MGQKLQKSQLELEAIQILNIALALLDEAESFSAGAMVSGALDRLRAAHGLADDIPFPVHTGWLEFGAANSAP